MKIRFLWKWAAGLGVDALAAEILLIIKETNMKTITYVFLTLVSLFADHAIASDSPKPVDASKLEIAGVRVGMSKSEAINAITSTLKINKKKITYSMGKIKNPMTGKEDPMFFLVRQGVGEFVVTLTPNVQPNNPATTVVWQVSYQMPWTNDNVKAMEKAALAKYGPPSILNGMSNTWCLEPNREKSTGCGFAYGPVIEQSANILTLHDLSYFKAFQDFQDKKNSGKPTF